MLNFIRILVTVQVMVVHRWRNLIKFPDIVPGEPEGLSTNEDAAIA